MSNERTHLAEEDITTTWPNPWPQLRRSPVTLLAGSQLRSLLRELLEDTPEPDASGAGALAPGDIVTTWTGR